MRMKRILSGALVCLSLFGLLPRQAMALTQGSFSVGGNGVNWTCGAKAWPCFTITMLDEEFKTPINSIDTSSNSSPADLIEAYKQQFRDQYKMKIPNVTGASGPSYGRLYMMPTWLNESTPVDQVNDVATYDYGQGEQHALGTEESAKVMFKLRSPVYDKPAIINTIENNTFNYLNNHSMDSLSGQWGYENTTGTMTYDDAYNVMCWIFQSDSGIEDRIGEILYDDYYSKNHTDIALHDDSLLWQASAMITMGMIMYYVAYYSPDEKSYYNHRIDEYLEGSDREKKPLLFEIEPASIWVTVEGLYFVMNCIDFLELYLAVPYTCSLRASTWNVHEWDIYSLLEVASNYVMNTFPGRKAQQQFYHQQGEKYNLWTYGFSLPTGIHLQLDGGSVVAAQASKPGYVKNVWFFNDMYGFFIGYNPAITNMPKDEKAGGQQDICTADPLVVTVPAGQPTIGQDVNVELKSVSDASDKSRWESVYGKRSDKPNFILAAKITKDGPPTNLESLGALKNDEDDVSCKLSYQEMSDFIDGKTSYNFKDNTTSVVIMNGQVISIEYTSEVWFTEDTGDPSKWDWIRLTPNDGKARKVFKRDNVMPTYTSTGTTYSEIKNNKPGDEEFEAMAGTPTTRSLYYATGGSEFIVDVDLEYINDCTSSRHYKVQFTKAPCDLSGTLSCKSTKGHSGDSNCGQHYDCAPAHEVGGDSYNWGQDVNYDYMKIKKAQVWKIEKSQVDGMSKITSAGDIIKTSIGSGDPNVYYNVASVNDASHGRLIYSLEPQALDYVTWELPTSTSCTHWKQDNQALMEREYKTKTTSVTVVSDFLILQTSKGDQSVMYFDKKSGDPVPINDNQSSIAPTINVPKSSEDEMWKNNPNSAANWDVSHITTGSYNGKYKNVDSKYNSVGVGGTVNTAFDSGVSGILQRPERPGDKMEMYTTFDPKVKDKNGLYKTGDSKTFYKHIVDVGNQSDVYQDSDEAVNMFGSKGMIYESPYSPSHSKVNDIVLHDPVSSEKAMVIPLDSSRDQRTTDTKPAAVVPKQDTTEYMDVLPDEYENNIVFNGYARYNNSKGLPMGWDTNSDDINNTGYSSVTSSCINDDISAWSREHDKYWDGNQRSFGITNDTYHKSYYTQTFSIEPGKTYTLKGAMRGGGARIGMTFLDSSGNNIGDHSIGSTGEITRTANSNAVKVRVYMLGQGRGNFVFDNIQLYCDSSKGRFTSNDLRVFDWSTVRNPKYHSHAESGCTLNKTYTCNNLPLNAGGSLEYEWYNDEHRNYLWYDSNTGHERDFCRNHNSHPTGNTRIGGTPTTHVHTSSCSYTETWTCGVPDTSIPRSTYDNCRGELNTGATIQYEWYNDEHNQTLWYNENTGHAMDFCRNHASHPTGNTRTIGANTSHVHTEACIKNYPAEPKYTEGWNSSSIQPYSSPQSWEYIQKIKESNPLKPIETPSGTFEPGKFINLDYKFQVYFPNVGDFEGDRALGIRKTTANRGYGFVDNMDTTEWTKSKYAIFQFDVIFNGVMYRAGQKVYLNVNEDTFDFYCPVENREAIQAGVDFVSIGINNSGGMLDNDESTNKMRKGSKLRADHSSIKTCYIDVVGRIGNMSIQDTGDFRFANFFKKTYNNGEWLIPNIVPTVNIGEQNLIVGDQKDIRGLDVSDSTKYLNTYGIEPYKEQKPYAFPLSPTYNNIEALKRQPLRIGYPTFLDVDTIGNYIYGNVDVLPYYYSLDLGSGKIEPVDIYMSVNGSYKLINKFDKLTDGKVNDNGVYDNKVFLNWSEEYLRRNYIGTQQNVSQDTADYYTNNHTMSNMPGYSGTDKYGKVETPYGKYYVMGNNNSLELTPRARSFIGTQNTYEKNMNPGNVLNKFEYSKQGQRWHFTLTLPSTAIVVRAGKSFISDGPNKTTVADNTHVILGAVDLKAIGDTYALKGTVKNNLIRVETITTNGNITSHDYDISKIPQQVVVVHSSEKTSKDDMTTSGTH